MAQARTKVHATIKIAPVHFYPWIWAEVCPTFSEALVRDRILGCILGGAIGDAFGRPYETLRPPIVISEADEWRLSDDTQLTLATCEAITGRDGSVDPAAIAAAFADWHRAKRVTGMGSNTLKALTELAAGGQWDGSNDLLRLVVEVLPDTQVRDRLASLTEIEKETPLLEIARRFGCSGFVAESVPLALCGASRIRSLDFKTVLIDLIACGGDTDTNASIAGQVAGALIGRSRLPEDLIVRTPDRDAVEAVASAFAESLNFYE